MFSIIISCDLQPFCDSSFAGAAILFNFVAERGYYREKTDFCLLRCVSGTSLRRSIHTTICPRGSGRICCPVFWRAASVLTGSLPRRADYRPGSCDLRTVFIVGDTLVMFIPSAGAADETFRDPVYRFSGKNMNRVLSRTHIVTGGRIGAVDNDFPDDSDFQELLGVAIENRTDSWKSYSAGDCAYRLPVSRSLAQTKTDPFPGPDMRQRYICFLTEAAVVLKGGGVRNFVHVVFLSLDP